MLINLLACTALHPLPSKLASATMGTNILQFCNTRAPTLVSHTQFKILPAWRRHKQLWGQVQGRKFVNMTAPTPMNAKQYHQSRNRMSGPLCSISSAANQ